MIERANENNKLFVCSSRMKNNELFIALHNSGIERFEVFSPISWRFLTVSSSWAAVG